MTKNLHKTTIVIWTNFNPKDMNIDALAMEAVEGEAYCSVQKTKLVVDPSKDKDWDGTEFFNADEDDDDDLIENEAYD